jgi:tetraacyldisaccharide 4'-kinase
MTKARAVRRLERLWYDGSALVLPLVPLSWLFALAVAVRRHLYAAGWWSSTRIGVPVIVVGNITVGGTGKTPFTAWLAQRLRAAGRQPGIVSRGYGGGAQRDALRVTAQTTAAQAGDEPVLLARHSGAAVAVCADRVRAARLLVEEGADIIIADDGLQHYALARDLEIALIDGDRRLGNGRLLPAGPLREPSSRLTEVALVMVNGGKPLAGEQGFTLQAGSAVALAGAERRALAQFVGQKVWALAGIGNPERFYDSLRLAGIEPVAVDVPDHGIADLARLRAEADWPILMTEKDAVKYPHCEDRRAWYLPVEVVMSTVTEALIMARVNDLLPGGDMHGR